MPSLSSPAKNFNLSIREIAEEAICKEKKLSKCLRKAKPEDPHENVYFFSLAGSFSIA